MAEDAGEMMDPSEEAELRRIVVDSARHTLPGCGICVDRESEGVESSRGVAVRDELTAFLGFSGDNVRGTLTLMGPVALMRRAYPLPLRDDQPWEPEVFDWAGEVANLLLGRIKHVLATRGVDIRSSTPQVVRGEQMNVWPSRRGRLVSVRFSVDPWWIGVWFEVTTPGAAALLRSPAAPTPLPLEGDVILF